MKVYCYPASVDSTYLPLLFGGIEDRYRPVHRQEGTLRDAIAEIDAGRSVIVHVHWEEFIFRDCRSADEADVEAAAFLRDVTALRTRQAIVFWTIHNELPHEIGFHRQFLAVRRGLAALAGAILVHNAVSIDVLARQVDLDRSKVHCLPHPSYLDRHEDGAALEAGLHAPHQPIVQGFGWIRHQKGFGDMIAMLPPAFLERVGARIRISGAGPEAAAVIAAQAARTDVEWDVRHVPGGEVPALLRSASCVVLPYERVLTSGVALLAMSVGAIVVAVDVPQLRALLPDESHRFLYRREPQALRDAIVAVSTLSSASRSAVVLANLEVAKDLHPHRIALRLAALYDRARSRASRAGSAAPR